MKDEELRFVLPSSVALERIYARKPDAQASDYQLSLAKLFVYEYTRWPDEPISIDKSVTEDTFKYDKSVTYSTPSVGDIRQFRMGCGLIRKIAVVTQDDFDCFGCVMLSPYTYPGLYGDVLLHHSCVDTTASVARTWSYVPMLWCSGPVHTSVIQYSEAVERVSSVVVRVLRALYDTYRVSSVVAPPYQTRTGVTLTNVRTDTHTRSVLRRHRNNEQRYWTHICVDSTKARLDTIFAHTQQ